MTLGERLKKLREDRGLYLSDLSEIIGVGKSTISGYEHNKKTPKPHTIQKLAEFYGVTTDYLLGQEDNLDDLEIEFPEAIQLIRKANKNLSDEGKEMLIKMMKAIIDK
ncbi:helix-turn-helix domain-containing protein [Vallitalea sp.]|jgi:transcriptional regulator with XRE-family HTH domain|uniref:helix-turn-helix domain-containing protein n=1 Tax=Vallitalea sp. TaxID=1882829 RepID=UPI0025E81B4D|nr:helix-turn-helix transcriptional regulator [Vallitalea sp.]MCT4685935.1 helix-turn-helix domain-containing protein [Vallitalea sp.]